MTAARTCQYIAHDQLPRQVTQEPSLDPINRKRPRHKWEREDREVLCLLYRFYDNSAKDLTAIFNYLFKDCLEREKFKNGLASTTLATQWHDMRIGSNGNDLWREINIDQTLMDCRTRYGDIKSSIEDAACALGLELCLRVQPPGVNTTHSHRLGKRAQRIKQVGEVLSDAMSAAEDTEPENERPNKLRRTRSVIDTPGIFIEAQSSTQVTTCASAPVDGGTPDTPRQVSSIMLDGETAQSLHVKSGHNTKPPKTVPRLLFRFSDDISAAKGPFLKDSTGFIAGSFVANPSDIPPVPTEILKALALIHLTPDQRISQTPFISFFSSMLPTFHRALRSSSNSFVTVVDSQIAENSLMERLGETKQVIYSVENLVTEFDLRLRNNYTGPTEFLIYGMVHPKAIVGIFNFNNILALSANSHGIPSVLQFDLIRRNRHAGFLGSKLKRLAPSLHFGTGQVVGRLLSLGKIPIENIEELAWKIACSWRFADRTAAKETGSYQRYMNGVFLACGQGRGASIGLEDQEEEEQDAVDEADNHTQHPSELDHLEVIEDCGPENDLEPANTNLESPEDERDLIDRQLESDCLEICADHHQAVLHEKKGKLCGDTGENDENGESPCPTRASSLDTFAKELFQVAEACAPVPQMAHVGDWEGSPWRSLTPHRRPDALRTITANNEQRTVLIDLIEETEEDESSDDAICYGKGWERYKEPIPASGIFRSKASVDFSRATTSRGKREKKVRKTGRVGREKADRGLVIIDSVNFSDD